MRWGFPHPKDWRRPQPIHARSETVDAIEPFRRAFHAGQRGIVVFRTFNEGAERAGIKKAAEIKAAVSTAEKAGFLVVHVDEPAVMLTAKGLEVARSR
jgi:hypothetical protein